MHIRPHLPFFTSQNKNKNAQYGEIIITERTDQILYVKQRQTNAQNTQLILALYGPCIY